jgi:hypothetical protein
LNAETRRSRTFPNHQAHCALLILLRFEFANEFRPPEHEGRRRAGLRSPRFTVGDPPSRRISARGVTPNHGDNVASPRRSRPSQTGRGRISPGVEARLQEKGDCWKGGAVRIRQHSNRPVSLEATVLPDELFCKPSRPVLIASPPFVAALLIGSKGVLNPKVQVQARRGVTL